MTSRPALWGKLSQFALDGPHAEFSFSDRLAKENGWTKPLACRAIEEYKKFVYLAAVSGGEVTPSQIVDVVWHQHLTYTRSYWEEMCGATLGFPLHHNPTTGGTAEDARFEAQYTETLVLYAQEFGEAPPAAYWPRPVAAQAPSTLTPIARARNWWIAATLAVAAVPAMLGAVQAADGQPGPKIPMAVIGVGVAVLVIFLAALGSRFGKRGRGGKSGYTCSASGDGGSSGHHGGHGDGGGRGHGSCGGHGGCGGGH